jgi:hypothetical protein
VARTAAQGRLLKRRARVVAVLAALMSPLPARAAVVWAIDDGERIPRDAVSLPYATGAGNPVWSPGQPIRLFALRDEVVAYQIVVAADGAPLDGVSVDVAPFAGPRGDAIRSERFIEWFFEIPRQSSADGEDACLGWVSGSGPPPGRFTGVVPDALIPVEVAPAWAPWPMRVAARGNGVVWIDVTVPRDQPAGTYRALVTVRGGGETLATLPVELEVLDATLPARPIGTLMFYGQGNLRRRIGAADAAERQLWTLFRQHRLTPVHNVAAPEDVARHLPALDGSFYTDAGGYRGPAEGVGDDVVVLGAYGTLEDPTPDRVARVEKIADELAAHGAFDRADVVLFAEDEDCTSPRGAGWRAALAGSSNANARRVRVTWTCSEDPANQPVDVPMVLARYYDAARAATARAAGKETWIYNGLRPATGTIMTDTEAVSLRTYGWIAAMAGIPRWFVWETVAWYDANKGGRGPFDPFTTAETFHNAHGDALMGDGVIVYPGRQVDRFTEHSVGIDGVLPSIRLKNLRRGIQDAGYYLLARGAATDDAERIARALFPAILGEARPGAPPSWSEHGSAFFKARRELAGLIAPGADPGPRPGVGRYIYYFRWRKRHFALLALVALSVAVLALWFRRRRKKMKQT